jgi:hypothetical protein
MEVGSGRGLAEDGRALVEVGSSRSLAENGRALVVDDRVVGEEMRWRSGRTARKFRSLSASFRFRAGT